VSHKKQIVLFFASFCLTVGPIAISQVHAAPTPERMLAQQTGSEQTAASDYLRLEGLIVELLNEGSVASQVQLVEELEKVLSLARSENNHQVEALALAVLGVTHGQLDHPEEALGYLQQSLSLSEAFEDNLSKTFAFIGFGIVYENLGETATALDYLQQAVALSQTAYNPITRILALNALSGFQIDLGQSKVALEGFRRALALSRGLGDQNSEAHVMSNMGLAYDALGEQETALDYLQQSLTLSRVMGVQSLQASALNNTGLVYQHMGDVETALDYYQQAIALSQELTDQKLEATILNNIGGIYNESLGDATTALSYFQQALAIYQTVDDRRGKAMALHNTGLAYLYAQDETTALSYFQQALPILQAVGDRKNEAYVLHATGYAYHQRGDLETALDYYEQTLALSRTVGDRRREAVTLGNIALLYRSQNQSYKALENINTSVSLIEDLRSDISPGELRASYFATVQGYYSLKQDILMQLGQPEAAFEASEAARSRLLIELLSEANVNIRQGVELSLLEQEESLQTELSQLEKQRIVLGSGDHTPEQAATLDRESDAVLQQLDQIITQIRRSSPVYADIVKPEPLTLSQVQQQVLDADTVLLQYALGKDQSYLWIVGQNKFQTYTLPGEANIQAVASQFQSTLTTQGNSSSDVKRKGEALRELILPEQPDWLQDKRLLVAGDGILSELPFAALPLPNQDAYTPLIAEHEVLTQPSITAISILRQQLANRGDLPPSLAVLADPVYRADDARFQVSPSNNNAALPSATERNLRDLDLRAIERLPYTRQESDNILQLAEQNNLAKINALDFEANADWVRSPELKNYSMVHLATHGFINPVNPQLSGIVLSLVDEGGQLKENGFLRLHDIFNLKLASELVVLSACQTGQGENVSGEGIVGLSRGFMYAGAKRVAVSLWNVNDAATAELMSEFYRYMLEDELTPAAAMRKAQLDAWDAGQSPYLWAAFTLQGEWQP